MSSVSTEVRARPERWPHQQAALEFAREKEATLVHVLMGGGKSRTTIDLWEEWQAKKILVVAPLPVIQTGVWTNQIKIHGLRDYVVQSYVKGSVAKRVEKAQDAYCRALAWDEPFVLLINYDACWRKPMDDFLKSIEWDVVACDEIHRISAPDTKSSMYMHKLRTSANKKLGLTGTPMRNSPLDIFGQFRFLDPTIFGLNFTYFKQTYAKTLGQVKSARLEELTMLQLNDMATEDDVAEIKKLREFFQKTDKNVLNNTVLDYKNQEAMNERFYRIAFRSGDIDLHLPEVMHETRHFDLSSEARTAYDQMEENLIAQIKEGTVTAANVLVAIQRLQQITGGSVPIEDGGKVIIDKGKAELLEELFEDSDPSEPWVVFAWYTEDLARVKEVAEKNGRKYFELSGRRKDFVEWQNSKSGDVVGIQIASGSEGIDATRARYCAVYSFRGSVASYDQMLARVHRPGQKRPVTYYYLVARNSIDGKIHSTIRRRRELINEILSLVVDRSTDYDVVE